MANFAGTCTSDNKGLLLTYVVPHIFTILRQLEGSRTGRGASSRVSLNLSKKTSP